MDIFDNVRVDLAIVEFNGTDMSTRLSIADVRELNEQLNVNLTDTDSGSDGDSESWFASEYVSPDMRIVNAEEFFDRFCS